MRKLFAIDSDWITTTFALISLPLFGLIAAALIRNTIIGNWSVSRPSFFTICLVVYCAVVLISTPERFFKLAIGLFLIHPVLELMMWSFKAPIDTYRTIAVAGRLTDIILCIGLVAWDVVWFKARIRITQSSD